MKKEVVIIIVLVFFLFVLGAFLPAGPATYYVAKSGSDSNSGSESSPWLTIQKAANTVNPGDTVYVKAGTYANDVLFRRSGNANNYITFQNYSTDIVTITWDGDQRTHPWPDDGSAYNGGLFALGAVSYIKIKGFRFANTGIGITVGISKGANHIIIEGNVFDDVTGAAVYTGYYKLNSNDDYAAWNIDVINNYMRREGTGYDPNQWYSEFVSNSIVSNNNISYNTITHNGNGECITYKEGSDNGVISNNDISNCYSASGGTAIGVAEMLSQAIYVDGQQKGVKNVNVFNNIAHRTQGIFVGSEFGGIAEDISIYNNIIYDSQVAVNVVPYRNQDKSLCANCPDPGYRNIYVYNNIGYNTISPYGGAYGGHVYSSTPYENIVWKNNILWASKIQNEWLDGSCPGCLQGNVIENNNFDKYGNIFDPLFVDQENHDFHLKSTSPAINAGTATGAPSTDFDGNARPYGNKYDIGAYEYIPPGSNPPNPIIRYYSNTKSNDNSNSITFNVSESVIFSFTADQTVIGHWTKDGSGVCSSDLSCSLSWSSNGTYHVTAYGSNINGSTSTITWTIQILPEKDYPSKIGVGGASWFGHSTMDNLYADNQLIRPGIYRDDFDDGTYDFDIDYTSNLLVYNDKLKSYGGWTGISKNIGNQIDTAMFLKLTESNVTSEQIFGARSDTSRASMNRAYKAVLNPNGTTKIEVTNINGSKNQLNTTALTRTNNVESSYVFKTCGNNQKLYASSTGSYQSALENLISSGRNNEYSYGNRIYLEFEIGNTEHILLDDIRILKTDSSCNILHSGNLTAHYEADLNNVVESIIVNASADADYTLEYRQYQTADTWISLGTNLSGSQTKNTINGNKYRNTEIRITWYFNDTSSPEIRNIEFSTKTSPKIIYSRYDVDENGIVDLNDLILVGRHLNVVSFPYPIYDVNQDGLVNIYDIRIAGQHLGEQYYIT